MLGKFLIGHIPAIFIQPVLFMSDMILWYGIIIENSFWYVAQIGNGAYVEFMDEINFISVAMGKV